MRHILLLLFSCIAYASQAQKLFPVIDTIKNQCYIINKKPNGLTDTITAKISNCSFIALYDSNKVMCYTTRATEGLILERIAYSHIVKLPQTGINYNTNGEILDFKRKIFKKKKRKGLRRIKTRIHYYEITLKRNGTTDIIYLLTNDLKKVSFHEIKGK